MNENVKFSGVMSALVSCIDDQGNVKEDSMKRLMNWHMDAGLGGFYLCGGTGEGPVLHAIEVVPAEKAKEDIVYFN